jgi:hypothetical protein
MVTDEKIYNIALIKYRLGLVLIWLGVLTWLPFILLRIAGEKPSLFWYLPFHLVGVVGGSRLRSSARKEISVPPARRSLLQLLGHGMIFSGILVWVPYFYLKAAMHQPVEVMSYLPYHLAGVLGGIAVLGVSYLISRKTDPAQEN